MSATKLVLVYVVVAAAVVALAFLMRGSDACAQYGNLALDTAVQAGQAQSMRAAPTEGGGCR